MAGGPLSLGSLDGGSHGHQITWRSADLSRPAIVDGGTRVTGWKRSPIVKGAFVAPLPLTIEHGAILRQLWVNGARAQRPVVYAVNLDGRSPGGLNARGWGGAATQRVLGPPSVD